MKVVNQVGRSVVVSRQWVIAGCMGVASLLLSTTSVAGGWSSTNFQYHYGTEYELGDEKRTLLTLEHANGWKYGDNFFFVDVTNPDKDGEATTTTTYSELSPRLSFGKMTGKDLSFGIVSDVLVASTVEMGDGFHNYLYGLGVNLNIPGFKFFEVDWYARHEVTFGTDTGQQITLAWGMPFSLGKAQFSFEGFFDYAWDVDPSEDNIVTQPRLLLDVGSLWGSPGAIQAGIEYQIWRNKYGIDGVDEDFPELMVKWIF